MDKEKLTRLGKIALVGLATVGVAASAAGVASEDTLIGKMINFGVDDLWGNAGVILGAGLPIAAGAWEAKATNSFKPIGYGVAAGIVIAGAFFFGTDMYNKAQELWAGTTATP